MNDPQHKNRPFFAGMILIILLILCWRTPGFFGGADNYNHFKMAADAFKFPKLFLNLWGKPVFVSIMSLPAQLGIGAVKISNVLIAFFTAILLKKTGDRLKIPNTNLLIVFTLFAPLYTALSCSSMTEILFSFILVLSTYLFSAHKYQLGAIVMSLIPFARLEGFGILLFVGLYLLIQRKWLAAVLLISGTAIFSLIGSWVFDSFFWIIEQWPHPADSSETYGKGSLFYFVQNIPHLLGWPIATLFGLGLFTFFTRFKISKNSKSLTVLLMIAIIGLYISAHSYLWWQGKGGSAGLLRVLGGILPYMSFIALLGWNQLASRFLKSNFVRTPIQLAFSVFLILYAVMTFDLPHQLHFTETPVKKALEWHQDNVGKNNVIHYDNAIVYVFADRDRKDKFTKGIPNKERSDYGLIDNKVYLWTPDDEHHLPLASFQENDNIKTLKVFQPDFKEGQEPINYRVYLFTAGSKSDSFKKIFHNTFENKKQYNSSQLFHIDSINHPEKGIVYNLDSSHIFSPTYRAKLSELDVNYDNVNEFMIEVEFYSDHILNENEFSLVGTMERDKSALFYGSVNPRDIKYEPKKWGKMQLSVPIPADSKPDDLLSAYVWYQGKKLIAIDNLKIVAQ
jgi:hypothetical protein